MNDSTGQSGSSRPGDDDMTGVRPVPPTGELTPGAARRRLASELRALREEAGLTLEQAGDAIERSAATVSRFESCKSHPRAVDVLALLNLYGQSISITNEAQGRILNLQNEGKKEQWYSPFRNTLTGQMLPAHILKLVEYETDAVRIRNYESDRIPGLLQTRNYARAVGEAFFPSHTSEELDQFAEFRLARQARLTERGNPRLSFVVNEVALRRSVGPPEILREQLDKLAREIEQPRGGVELRIIPMSTATPAAMDGPFVIMSFSEDSEDLELVYCETRSGATYLNSAADVGRFDGYFEELKAAALTGAEAVELIRSISAGGPGRDRTGPPPPDVS